MFGFNKNIKQTPKEDCEDLLTKMFPISEAFLQKNGEFFPFASVMLQNNEIEMIATHNGDEHPESQTVINDLNEILIKGANEGINKATCLVYMSMISNTETNEKFDVVSFNLDHKDNYSIIVVFPYTIETGKVQFYQPSVMESEDKIYKR